VSELTLNIMVDVLKTVAETTRLRIVVLLQEGDLTVSDLTTILGQSQPRVSRHLKLLQDAGVVERYQEGAWAYFRLSDDVVRGQIIDMIAGRLARTGGALEHDHDRLQQVKQQHRAQAAAYFSANAAEWDALRRLHVPDKAVEEALLQLVGDKPFQTMLDIGTGTAAMLKLFAPFYARGVGVDVNREMLAIARDGLEKAGITHALVRQGDIAALPVELAGFDLVVIHQVLHFLDYPALAIREAARVLQPDGRLVIVDFSAHNLEFLRNQYAHQRLGFTDTQIRNWLREAELEFVTREEFVPGKDRENGLTVQLWMAHK